MKIVGIGVTSENITPYAYLALNAQIGVNVEQNSLTEKRVAYIEDLVSVYDNVHFKDVGVFPYSLCE